MIKAWDDDAWDDYLHWQTQDRKTLRRINALLKDIDRNGYDGIGKPEPLRENLSGWWSRRIDDSNRMSIAFEKDVSRSSNADRITETTDALCGSTTR